MFPQFGFGDLEWEEPSTDDNKPQPCSECGWKYHHDNTCPLHEVNGEWVNCPERERIPDPSSAGLYRTETVAAVAAFVREFKSWLETPDGRFACFVAERERKLH